MKKRIGDLLNEKFEYRPAGLHLSAERIEGRVRPDQRFRGKFSVAAAPGELAQGFVYSDNMRLSCKPEYFIGQRETFLYEADTAGLMPGETLAGNLVLCTVSGEYTLPYCFTVEDAAREMQPLPPMTLAEFTALARENFGKAYMLFTSPGFLALIEDWDVKAQSLYEGIVGQSVNYHSLEQFLLGLGQKEPMTVHVDNTHLYLRDPQENEREELLLTRNTWGFSSIHISCDAPFLAIERPDITTEEFAGSTFSVGFVIDRGKLHAGRNFARISVTTECRRTDCTVEVRLGGDPAALGAARQRRQETLQLANAYISWRAGRTQLQDFAGLSLSCLDNLKKNGRFHIFYELYRIYLLFLSDRQVEAQMLLEEVTAYKTELLIPQWKGFYLYLTTLGNTEKDYTEYVKEEIFALFLANQENWILQWVALQIGGERFRNDSERLDAIRRQYICGCKSPVMYLEAWELLKKEPLLLRVLGEFEIHLLVFMCRENLLQPEICGQAAQLAGRITTFQPLLYRMLCRCYERYPSKNMLTAICALLMKGHKSGPAYEKWFETGVCQDVRLAGLYEYYAQSVQNLNARELPPSVRMYFSYNNMLGYVKKAAIYANIIRGREKDPETFESYRPSILRFMEEQLAEGRIQEDLALIYDALLSPYLLDERMSEGLSRILYTNEILCENPEIRHAVVVHRQLCQEQRVPFANGRACVQCYSADACVLLEGKDGARYADTSLFAQKRLLGRPVFEDYCRAREKIPEGILLHDCCEISKDTQVNEQNELTLVQFTALPRVRGAYRSLVREKLLEYYAAHPGAPYLREYLQSLPLDEAAREHPGELAELLVSEGMCREAYRLVQDMGPEKLSAGTLVRLCSFQAAETEMQEDAYLLKLCACCFSRKHYDETVLKYLLRYYDGPIETMKAVFEAGRQFGLEEFALEEKILVMILYMRCGMENSEPVFEAYLREQGKARVCRAYVIWMSYCYFVREMAVADPVFAYIERVMNGEADAPQVCQLALLKYYALHDHLSAGQQKWRGRLLEKCSEKGMYFRFYRKFPTGLLRHFHLHDKYVFEYRGDPAAHVTMHYRLNGEKERQAVMLNCYEGIFVKEFTLFYQDRLEWHFSIESGGKTETTPPQTFVCGRRSHRGSVGRYELINRLAEAVQKQDAAQIQEIRKQYVGEQYLVEQLFELN